MTTLVGMKTNIFLRIFFTFFCQILPKSESGESMSMIAPTSLHLRTYCARRLVSIKRVVFYLCCAGIVLATFYTVRTNDVEPHRELYADYGNHSVENSKIPQDDWTCIRKDFCLYSAHYDNTSIDRPAVRVFGIAGPRKTWNNMSILCQYMGAAGAFPKLIQANARAMLNEDDTLHTIVSLVCDLDEKWEKVRVVLVNPSLETEESIYLRIHYPPPVFKYRVAICVKPFHSRYNGTIRLLEWIEYYKMLGVQHFTFYNYSSTPEVGEILKSYDPDIVTILPWGMDMGDYGGGIDGYGEYLSCTECPHRHRGVTKYLMAIDVDEFMALPSMFNNFYEYLESLWNDAEMGGRKTINSLRFYSRCSFNNWELDESGYFLSKLEKKLHKVLEGIIIPFRTRYLPAYQPKFIMKPDLITDSGIHRIRKGTGNTTDVFVPVHIGYYLHVRDCFPDQQVPNPVLANNATCNQTTGIPRDTYFADRFGMELLRSVTKKIESTIALRRIFDIDQ